MTRADEDEHDRATATSAALAVLLLVGLAAPARGDEVVRMSGTGTALGMLEQMGDAFARTRPGTRVEVLPNLGSSGAVQAVAKGALDVAISGRPLKQEEQALGLRSFEITRTPFVFAVGPGVGVRAITTAELAQLFRGEKLTWPNGERIRLVLRPPSDADTIVLKGVSAELAAAVDAARARPGMLMAVTNQESDELVERTPGAIGGTTLMQLRSERRALSALAWNGVEPSVAALLAGAYPLGKALYVVLRREPAPAVRRWLEFVCSAQGTKILEQLGGNATSIPSGEP
jgi:phosphate transport system substrate-binding protein